MESKWRQANCFYIDTNEDLTNGKMDDMLSSEVLGMREVARAKHQVPLYTEIVGQKPIDGCYVMPDLPEFQAAWLSAYKCIGDHCFPMVKFESSVLLGENIICIVQPQGNQLNCKIPKALKKYTELTVNHMTSHKLLQKLHNI